MSANAVLLLSVSCYCAISNVRVVVWLDRARQQSATHLYPGKFHVYSYHTGCRTFVFLSALKIMELVWWPQLQVFACGRPIFLPQPAPFDQKIYHRNTVFVVRPLLPCHASTDAHHPRHLFRLREQGGALATCLHTHMEHGNPFVRGLVQRTMVRACEPLFFMMKKWVFEGELVDNHK